MKDKKLEYIKRLNVDYER